ncbi:MAG: hypothetical protein KBC84_05720 [Proteobacteria bacterium]|nr:hypothetical protein [Pseudomonadota bacterium]
MKKIKLIGLAYGRSGDKGDKVNIGILARDKASYDKLKKILSAEKVATYFQDICKGSVARYELDNLWGLNFVLDKALDGGGSASLRIDAQGKTLAAALLRMEIEID